jgi:hypothetical protein
MSETQNRLKAAMESVAVPPYLGARIRSRIRTDSPLRKWTFRLAPIGAAAAIFAGLAAYQLGHLRWTPQSQESYISTLTGRIASVMAIGLGDHIHCSIFRKYREDAPKVEAVVAKLGAEYKPLVPIVQRHVPRNYELVLAHECRYQGRRFTHLSLKNGSHMMSMVIAGKREGETFDASGLLPAFAEAGLAVYQTEIQRFAITAFESRDSLIYFVSDLPQEENTKMLTAMTPQLREFFAQREL